MQLIAACGGILASYSFVANLGRMNATMPRRHPMCAMRLGGINSSSVFKEAEELLSELPAQTTVPPSPLKHRREMLTPKYSNVTQDAGSVEDDDWYTNDVAKRNIQNIINSTIGGRRNTNRQHAAGKAVQQPKKNRKKYGPGKPVDMKIWMNIGTNDLLTRCKRARKFLEDGIPIMFKIEGQGHAENYMTHGRLIVNTAMSVLSDVAKLGGDLQIHTNFLSQIFNPLVTVKRNASTQHVDAKHRDAVEVPGSVTGSMVNGLSEPSGRTGMTRTVEPAKPATQGPHGTIPTVWGQKNVQHLSATTFKPDGSTGRSGGVNQRWTEAADACYSDSRLPPVHGYDNTTPNDHSHFARSAPQTGIFTATTVQTTRDAARHNAPESYQLANSTLAVETRISDGETMVQLKSQNSGGNAEHAGVPDPKLTQVKGVGKDKSASKFMTIEKPTQVLTANTSPTANNDVMLKRFIEMRSGTMPRPAAAPPVPNVMANAPPPPVQSAASNPIPPYVTQLQRPRIEVPYVSHQTIHHPYNGGYAGQNYNFAYERASRPMPLAQSPPAPVNSETRWPYTSNPSRSTTPAVTNTQRLSIGTEKTGNGAKSRWIVLDKDNP
ncbi:hypothetical protein, conserved [Babesia bigemina]|uniref:Uncharacterized protein n=1 Tax=Babesia bigemina TaxID=5866 RepID=A0A061DBG7_BABBI|nr:hypothetical protein, conserved [Babesia bigemina]CDR95090.1 hypothetical protein, conserved [Babesia bigemina]|eukprot:XP_012767276.1 hypothetical protein, conserved [Babesia bigemina]